MTRRFDVAAEHVWLASRLRATAAELAPERRLAVPEAAREVLGLHKTSLLAVAREWRERQPKPSDDELLALCWRLWAGATREEQMLATRLLPSGADAVPAMDWETVQRWRREVDSVEAGDAFAVSVLGPWVLHDVPRRLHRARVMLVDGDLMDRRLALLVTVWLNRRRPGAAHAEVTVEFVDQVLDDREQLIMDAASWALRALARSHRDVVEQYIASREQLAPLVAGEVRNWLATGTRSGLTTQPWRIPAGGATEAGRDS